MSIINLYEQYNIMPSLQQHMLTVAAVAAQIADHMTVQIDREELIQVCLLHDMGNIVKFKIGQLPELLEPEGFEYWKAVQDGFLQKYGDNEHEAILEELHVSERVIELYKGAGNTYFREK